jgi:hypothetical protein
MTKKRILGCLRVPPRLNTTALEHLKLHTLRKRRYHLDALFLIQVYLGSKFCPSVLETVGLHVPTRHLNTFLCSMFALQLKPVLLLDALQPLMLSAGTVISLENKMSPLNIFYLKQNTYS